MKLPTHTHTHTHTHTCTHMHTNCLYLVASGGEHWNKESKASWHDTLQLGKSWNRSCGFKHRKQQEQRVLGQTVYLLHYTHSHGWLTISQISGTCSTHMVRQTKTHKEARWEGREGETEKALQHAGLPKCKAGCQPSCNRSHLPTQEHTWMCLP